MRQVASEFKKKKGELRSAKRAAIELGVSLASFYKYVQGKTVPDMDVLRRATLRWGIKWKYLDPTEVVRPRKVKTARQLVFAYLSEMQEEDVEIVEVTPDGGAVLRVSLRIRIPV